MLGQLSHRTVLMVKACPVSAQDLVREKNKVDNMLVSSSGEPRDVGRRGKERKKPCSDHTYGRPEG